jgi:uncharacterized protein YndB with AHSA1/START domain
MVRQTPLMGPSTLERPRASARTAPRTPLLPGIACEVTHGRTTVVMPREFAHPAADVWTLLTDPQQLTAWSPYTADRNLSMIGRATLTMLDGAAANQKTLACVVFTADAPRSLEYSWGEDTLSWMLEPAPATAGATGTAAATTATRLTLRQTLADPAMASAVAAGWHLCLDVAASILDGHPMPAIRGMAAMDHGWADLNRRYAAKLGVTPTQIG